jgi:hypothetical protein
MSERFHQTGDRSKDVVLLSKDLIQSWRNRWPWSIPYRFGSDRTTNDYGGEIVGRGSGSAKDLHGLLELFQDLAGRSAAVLANHCKHPVVAELLARR